MARVGGKAGPVGVAEVAEVAAKMEVPLQSAK